MERWPIGSGPFKKDARRQRRVKDARSRYRNKVQKRQNSRKQTRKKHAKKNERMIPIKEKIVYNKICCVYQVHIFFQ